MAPALLFDKSFLQSLSLDEAVILDQLYFCTITPLFFAETIGSLSKDAKNGKVPEKIVSSLAEKTPIAHSYMSAFHVKLIHAELNGMEVEMRRRPPIDGGIPVQVEGEKGLVFKKSEEAEAFERWQKGEFSQVERTVSSQWREHLEELQLSDLAAAVKKSFKGYGKPKNHESAHRIARNVIEEDGFAFRNLHLAMRVFGFDALERKQIVANWKKDGHRSLKNYAPYTAFCLEVELYFYLAISNGIVSDQRPSNKIDIGYLFYLPFCHVFASGDKLHRASASLFLGNDQFFAWGPSLKDDLKTLNKHFLQLPKEDRAKGIFTLVTEPPRDHPGLTAQIWDLVQPGWREKVKKPIIPMSEDAKQKLLQRGNKFQAAAEMLDANSFPLKSTPKTSNASVLIQRNIPRRRGSWEILPPDIGKK